MTPRNKTSDSKSNEKGKKSAKSGHVDVQDGDMRSAILEIIQTDEDIMNSVIESVSQAIVTKFMNNPELMDKLTKKVIESGVIGRVKQELYESFKFDAETSAENLNAMGQRVGKLERANDALRDDVRWGISIRRWGRRYDHGLVECTWQLRLATKRRIAPTPDYATLKRDPIVAAAYDAALQRGLATVAVDDADAAGRL